MTTSRPPRAEDAFFVWFGSTVVFGLLAIPTSPMFHWIDPDGPTTSSSRYGQTIIMLAMGRWPWRPSAAVLMDGVTKLDKN